MIRFTLPVLAALFLSIPATAQSDKPVNFVYAEISTQKTVLPFYARRLGQTDVLLSGGTFSNFSDREYYYREYYAGIGFDFGNEKIGLWPFILYSSTSDGDYLQLWAFPYFENDQIWTSVFLGGYIPIGVKNEPQVFMIPARIYRPLTRWLGAGMAYRFYKVHSSNGEHSLGPSIKLRTDIGNFQIDFLKGLENTNSRIALSYFFMF